MTLPESDNSENSTAPSVVGCAICKKATTTEYEPFCSKHCADVDLHRWLSGRYAVPAAEDESDADGGDDD